MDTEKKTKASALSSFLGGSSKDRIDGPRTLHLEMVQGKRPEVVFTGFWNGTFIRAAMDSISKAYRVRRHRTTHPLTPSGAIIIPNKGEKGKGEHV